MAHVFLSGGTGYMGRALTAELLARGHSVRVLVRSGSEPRVAPGADVVAGNALDGSTFLGAVNAEDTFIHLIGVAHPAPWKEAAFRAVDLESLRASAGVAQAAGLRHFVYVSVAQPAPVMRAYLRVRRECETLLAELGLTSTILRPWYVLGPGRRWPLIMEPIYALLEAVPPTRDGALRLGLVMLEEMVAAMVWAVEHPPESTQVIEVPQIREIARRGNVPARLSAGR